MTEAALGLDRLPWLPDDPPVRRVGGSTLPWILAAGALLAVLGYGLGVNVFDRSSEPATTSQTVPLPRARALKNVAPEQLRTDPAELTAGPPIAVGNPSEGSRSRSERSRVPASFGVRPEASSHASRSTVPDVATEPNVWPVRAVDGARGRLIRIGAFGSVHQAKLGWWSIVRANPAIQHLPALVVPVRSQDNHRIYYRLQMGTTSQAHSAVLCQRLRIIGQSCVVIGTDGGKRDLAL